MQIVIDIPETIIEHISDGSFGERPDDKDTLVSAVMDGIPLPKKHGRLVDISRINEDMIDHDNPIIYLIIDGQSIEAVSLDYLDELPTIIEAYEEAKMKAYKCDRCGKFFSRPNWDVKKVFITNSRTESGLTKDLCDECQKELEAWWMMKKAYNKNLCDSCTNKECMFQSGVIKNCCDHCNFYKSDKEEK